MKIYFTLLFLLLAFAAVGEMDYQTQAELACEQHGGEWNGEFCKITVKDHCE